MRAPRLSRSRFIRWGIAGGVLFAALLLLLGYQGDRFFIQDSLFLSGFILIVVTLFRLALWSGLFNLLLYGYSQIIASFKSANKADEEARASFFDYNRSADWAIHWEPGLLGMGCWVASWVIRAFT